MNTELRECEAVTSEGDESPERDPGEVLHGALLSRRISDIDIVVLGW